MVYQLCCGGFPFEGLTKDALFKNIVDDKLEFKQKRWSKLSPECVEFVKMCLVKNPSDRKCAEDLMKHPWIEKSIKDMKMTKQSSIEVSQNMSQFSDATSF